MKTLKQLFIAFLLLTFSYSGLKAQSETFQKIQYGFTYGISINDVFNHESKYNFPPKFSPILIGSFIQFNQSDKLGLVAEIEYIHKGPESYVINYLTLSTLVRYEAFKGYPNTAILVGLYGGYLFDYKFYDISVEPDGLKSYDLGVDIGMDFTRKLTDKIDGFISPVIEIGIIRFSHTNHLSYQLKGGIRF
jgi:hypothetical protein